MLLCFFRSTNDKSSFFLSRNSQIIKCGITDKFEVSSWIICLSCHLYYTRTSLFCNRFAIALNIFRIPFSIVHRRWYNIGLPGYRISCPSLHSLQHLFAYDSDCCRSAPWVHGRAILSRILIFHKEHFSVQFPADLRCSKIQCRKILVLINSTFLVGFHFELVGQVTAFRSNQPSCLTGSTGEFFRQHLCCLSFRSACDQVHE